MADDGAPNLTEEEFANWLSPRDARAAVSQVVALQAASRAVFRRVADGLVRAASRSSIQRHNDEIIGRRSAIAPIEEWAEYNDGVSDFWAGEASFTSTQRSTHVYGFSHLTTTHYGIRLCPEDLRREFPDAWPAPRAGDNPVPQEEPANAPEATPPSGETRGRHPAAWWDDLWIAMCCHAFGGRIGPHSMQKDIEKAMAEWGAANGEEASPATYRTRARKLLAAFKVEGKNPES